MEKMRIVLSILLLTETLGFQSPVQIPSTTRHNKQQQQQQQHKYVTSSSSLSILFMAGGEGGDKEWAKALFEASGDSVGNFEQDMKMKGFLKGTIETNPKISANMNLINWLITEGNVYLSDQSSWGEAPHPMAISTDTVDEITNESSGRGLLARRDISQDDLLLCIPMKLCMTKSMARKALGKDIIQSGMNEYLAIALHLIYEKFVQKDKSFWKPYLDILPESNEVSPTFTWPESDLEFLQGSPVVAASISLQMKLRREYDALLGNTETGGLIAKYPDRFPADKFCFDNWVWAFTMLFSRAIRLRSLQNGETLALVPYADLINHSPFSQAYIDGRQTGDWLFKNGEEEVVLFADRSYRRMEQIYISYGPKSNAELLLLYGFAVERNPFNSVDVTVSIAPRTESMIAKLGLNQDGDEIEIDPLADEKIAFLEMVGRDKTVDFPCYADRYPVEMLEYLRLMQMTPADTGGKALSEFDYSRAISTANEAAVLSSVINAVKRQLSKYPQTEEDDAAIIKDKKLFRLLSYNQRMAVRHRRNEKRLLKRTIAALEKQIQQQGLDGEEISGILLQRADGNTLGTLLPGDERRYGISKQKTALEDKLEKMGLPVDIR